MAASTSRRGNSQDVNQLVFGLQKLKIQEAKPKRVKSNLNKTISLYQGIVGGWPSFDADETYRLTELDEESNLYQELEEKFTYDLWDDQYIVTGIDKVQNPYLLMLYRMNKRKYFLNDGEADEETLYHGTKGEYIPSICTNNFNWRYNGYGKGHLFGKGVSFSPKSSYAVNYAKGDNKVVFVADVLYNYYVVGHKDMDIPTDDADSSIKKNGDVIVKYDDNTFLPKYIIYFEKLY